MTPRTASQATTGMAEDPHDPRVEDRQDPAPARRRGVDARRSERDRRGERDQRRRDQHQQDVLDHVDREQRRVVAVDPGQEGERDRGQPGEERDRPAARDRVRRVGRVRPGGPPDQPPAATATRGRGSAAARTSSRAAGCRGRRLGRDGAVGERPGAASASERPPSGDRAPRRDARGSSDGRGIGGIVARTGRRRHRGADAASAAGAGDARDVGAPGIMAAVRPRSAGAASASVVAPRPGTRRHRSRTVMSSSPRTQAVVRRRSSPCSSAPSIIGLRWSVAGLGIDVLDAGGQIVEQLLPARSRSRPQGAADPRPLHIVFVIAVVIFLVVEGLIIWTRHPLPAQAGRRRAAAPDPRQQHRRDRLDGRPDDHRHLHVLRLVADAQHRRGDARRQPDLKVRAVAGQFQWSSTTCRRRRPTRSLFTESASRPGADGGLVVPAGQTIHLYLRSPDVIHAFYVPQFLFKRDVVPGVDNQFDLTVDASDAGQTFRGQCAELCGVGHRIMLFEVQALAPADFEAWLAEQDRRGQRDAAARRRAAGRRQRPARPGRRSGQRARASSSTQSDRSTAPGRRRRSRSSSTTRTRARPHDVDDPQDRRPAPKVFDGEIFPGAAAEDYDVPAARRPAPTSSSARSIRTMTGTLTVQ